MAVQLQLHFYWLPVFLLLITSLWKLPRLYCSPLLLPSELWCSDCCVDGPWVSLSFQCIDMTSGVPVVPVWSEILRVPDTHRVKKKPCMISTMPRVTFHHNPFNKHQSDFYAGENYKECWWNVELTAALTALQWSCCKWWWLTHMNPGVETLITCALHSVSSNQLVT